jgi:hypothetical protein
VICAECHIQQNAEADSTWKRIIATAGHAIHLNERSPAMRDMQCVTCHGEEVHKFKPASETCAQSGCHDRLDIQLGKMRDQTSMHCSTCHVFTAPTLVTNPTDSARAAIVPNEQQCLECHAMREQLRNFKPQDDPHNGVCGSCHNPHTQTSTVGAFQSCATSQCHALTDSLRVKHRSVRGHKLETCGGCHIAHTWTVGRTNCESCHTGITDPAVQVRRRPGGNDAASAEPYSHAATKPAHVIPVSGEGATHSRQAGMAFAPSPVGRVQRRSSNGEVALAQAQPRDTGAFQHARHRPVRCVTCHIGASVRAVARQCTACHHGNTAIGNKCESCHASNEIAGTHRIATNVSLSVWPAPRSRTLDFAHERHASVSCGSCHAANLSRAVEKTCASCHSEHHEATRSCASCHPSARATHTRELHITGCGGSGCHVRETTASITPARAVCLSCHVEQTEHKPGRECAPCHLSTWRPATGGGP